jgi:predicted MFS family arabinose efflux permease
MPLHAIAAILAASVCTMPSNVLPVLVGLLADAHGLNEAQIGYLVSTNMAAGLLASTTAPYWIVRVNAKYAVGACLALDACGLLGLSLAPNLPLLFVAQIVIGGATVGVSSICVTVLAQLPNPARALGIKITSDVIVAGTFLALAPVDRLGLSGFVGVLAMLFLLAIAAATPRLPARAIERTPAHLEMRSLRAAPLSAWLVLASLTMFYVGGNALWVFLSRLGEHAGFTREVTSNVIAAGLFAGIVGSLGATIAGGGPRFWIPLLGGVSFLLSAPWLVLASDLTTYTAAVFAFNAGWNFYTPFLMSLIAPRDPTRRMSSLIPAATMTGSIVGSTLMGILIRSHGPELATLVMIAPPAASILAFVVLSRTPMRVLPLSRVEGAS